MPPETITVGDRKGGLARRAEDASSRAAVLVVDDERRCLEASLSACRLLGAARSAVEGRLLDDLLAPDMRGRLDHVWVAFQESGGQAGPFAVASTAAPVEQVRISLSVNMVPGRHVVTLEPAIRGAATASAQRSAPAEDGDGHSPRVPTAREREILTFLAAGATDGQIARRLQLSPATVQTHVRNAKAKLGARTRAQAVALALTRGLIMN
jgi:DNA-binding CsgD family transcriptional regulator